MKNCLLSYWIYLLLTAAFAFIYAQSIKIDKMQQEMHQMQVVLTEGWKNDRKRRLLFLCSIVRANHRFFCEPKRTPAQRQRSAAADN